MSLQKKDKSKGTVKKSGTHKRDLKKTKNPKSDKAKRDKPAWMTKAPSATEKGKSKTIDIKYYWWCDTLSCWCRHHPSKCEAKRKQGNKDEKKLKIASAMEKNCTRREILVRVTPRGHSGMGTHPAGHR